VKNGDAVEETEESVEPDRDDSVWTRSRSRSPLRRLGQCPSCERSDRRSRSWRRSKRSSSSSSESEDQVRSLIKQVEDYEEKS